MNILTRTDIHNAGALNCDCISIIVINLVVLPHGQLLCTRYMDVIAYVTLSDVRDYLLICSQSRSVSFGFHGVIMFAIFDIFTFIILNLCLVE